MYQPQPIKVMLVDDEDKMRGLLRICIPWEQLDYVITDDVSSANQALELIAERKPDVIITDIEMPLMDGHRLTKLIKSDDETKDIPVVIFSSLVNDEMKRKGEALGADAQLSKPEIANLVRIIDDLVKK